MAAPHVQTPIQLSTHTRPRTDAAEHTLCTSARSDSPRAHVALGDVVRVSRSAGVRRRRGLVATVEQGVAVVLQDLQTQTPVHTYTLAPSDHACTAPLVVECAVGAGAERTYLRTTLLGLAAARGTDVWVLRERLDPHGRAAPDSVTHKELVHIDGLVHAFFALPSHELLAVMADGAVALLSDAHALPTVLEHSAAASRAERLDTRMLDANATQALLRGIEGARTDGVLGALLVLARGAQLALHAVVVHDSGESRLCTYGGELRGVHLDAAIAACALHESGSMALLSVDGQLTSCVARLAADHASVTDEAHSVQLAPALQHTPTSLVLLSPSHLLLLAAARDGGAGRERAVALLWDLDLDTVLSQIEWTLGSAQAPKGVAPSSITTVAATGEQVLALISPPSAAGNRGAACVLVVPVSVPGGALLRHALGTAAQSRAWLADAGAEPADATSASLLTALHGAAPQDAAQRAASVDAAFAEWMAQESARLREQTPQKASRKAPKPTLGHTLVAQVLEAAAPPAPAARGGAAPYAQQTLRYLLERNAVAAAMLDAGGSEAPLLHRVVAARDWTTMYLVLRHVPDLAEAQALRILREALMAHDADAPAPARVLAHMLAPPSFSHAATRVALRTHITEEEHVLVVLDILRSWLDARMAEPLTADARARRDGDDAGEKTVPGTQITYRTSEVRPPALAAVLGFAEDVLDTYFTRLLAMRGGHAFLAELNHAVAQHTQSMQLLSRLRGPLDAFAQAAQDAKHASEVGTAGRAPEEGKSRRLALYEASLVVPAYSVEQLEV